MVREGGARKETEKQKWRVVCARDGREVVVVDRPALAPDKVLLLNTQEWLIIC
jgi:hypothetical protein